MLNDLVKLARQIQILDGRAVEVSAVGVYPESKSHTKVQHVAKWQNDGTDKITPARFVEKAEAAAGEWHDVGGAAIVDFIDGDNKALDRFGADIARDINNAVDRIKTRRLKHSMRHSVK